MRLVGPAAMAAWMDAWVMLAGVLVAEAMASWVDAGAGAGWGGGG